MATIGRSAAVAWIGRLKISGYPAWLAWLFVHLIFLIGFRNRLAVLLQWTYSYFAYKRGARIITNPPPEPDGRAFAAERFGSKFQPRFARPEKIFQRKQLQRERNVTAVTQQRHFEDVQESARPACGKSIAATTSNSTSPRKTRR